MEPGPQVPDVGLPDRRWPEAAAVDRKRADRGKLAGILPTVERRSANWRPVRVQRHVAGIPEGDPRADRPGDPCARPVPPDEEDERGRRSSPPRRSASRQAGRLPAGVETFPLVPAEASGELDRPADGEAGGTDAAQLAVGAG